MQLMQQIAPGLTAKIGTRADTLDAMESDARKGGRRRRAWAEERGRGRTEDGPRHVIAGLSLLSSRR